VEMVIQKGLFDTDIGNNRDPCLLVKSTRGF
jgi:hypothetical protein